MSGIQPVTEERLFGEHVCIKAKSRWRCPACLGAGHADAQQDRAVYLSPWGR